MPFCDGLARHEEPWLIATCAMRMLDHPENRDLARLMIFEDSFSGNQAKVERHGRST